MESFAADRAVLAYDHDEEGALDGAQLISAETDPDLQREQDIFLFISGNFGAFLGYLPNLSLRDQDLLLADSTGRPARDSRGSPVPHRRRFGTLSIKPEDLG